MAYRLHPHQPRRGGHVSGAGEHAHFAPLPIVGAYTVAAAADHKGFLVHGEAGVTGFVSLRFGYRPTDSPPGSRAPT